jgi:hypothetical protein
MLGVLQRFYLDFFFEFREICFGKKQLQNDNPGWSKTVVGVNGLQ